MLQSSQFLATFEAMVRATDRSMVLCRDKINVQNQAQQERLETIHWHLSSHFVILDVFGDTKWKLTQTNKNNNLDCFEILMAIMIVFCNTNALIAILCLTGAVYHSIPLIFGKSTCKVKN